MNRCARCENPATEGSYFCTKHGGPVVQSKSRMYDLNKTEYLKSLAIRAKEIENNPEFTSVKTELGILRIILERLLTRCADDDQLLLRQGEVINLVDKIEKLTKTVREAEKELGLLLTREQARELAGKLLSVITDATNTLKNKIEDSKNTLRPLVSNPSMLDSLLGQELFMSFMEEIADNFGDAINGLQSKD